MEVFVGWCRFFTIMLLATMLVASANIACSESLDALLDEALSNNPEIGASRARWQMFVSKADQAGSLDDPMLMLGVQNLLVRDPANFRRDATSAKVIGISQQLPFWGKRELRTEIAKAEAESYRFDVDERKLQLTKLVKEAWYNLYRLHVSLTITDRKIELLEQLQSTAATRYQAGQGTQLEYLKAGVEKTKMLEKRLLLLQQQKSQQTTLNYLLNRSVDATVAVPSDLPLPAFNPDEKWLADLAAQHNPQLKSLSAQFEKGKAAHRLAQKELFPDFNLSFEYMFREPVHGSMGNDPGYNMFSLGLSFNLPLQKQRRRAMQAESASETALAASQLHAVENSIQLALADGLYQLNTKQQLVELYQDEIIPQAKMAAQSALINYQVGKGSYQAVLEEELALQNYEQKLLDSKVDYLIVAATLEAVVGKSL